MLLTLKRKNKKGFTLIELIVVVAILAILAAVAIPSFIGLRDEAEKGVAIANASSLASAVNVKNAMDGSILTKPASYGDLATAVGANLMPVIEADKQGAAFDRLQISDGIATVNVN